MASRWKSFKEIVQLWVDELGRLDSKRPRNRQQLLPLLAGVLRGGGG